MEAEITTEVIKTITLYSHEKQMFREQIKNRVLKNLRKKGIKSISTEEFEKLTDDEILKTKEKQNKGQLKKSNKIQTKYFDEKQTDIDKIFIICVFKYEPGCHGGCGFDKFYALSSNCFVEEIKQLTFNNKYSCVKVNILEKNEVLIYKEFVNEEVSCCGGFIHYRDFKTKKIEEIDKNVDFLNFKFKFFDEFVVYSYQELKNKLFKEKDKY
jgi:hypothetical protein